MTRLNKIENTGWETEFAIFLIFLANSYSDWTNKCVVSAASRIYYKINNHIYSKNNISTENKRNFFEQ